LRRTKERIEPRRCGEKPEQDFSRKNGVFQDFIFMSLLVLSPSLRFDQVFSIIPEFPAVE
jgi:hypothetical protein